MIEIESIRKFHDQQNFPPLVGRGEFPRADTRTRLRARCYWIDPAHLQEMIGGVLCK